MDREQRVFQIHERDNVATALDDISPGEVTVVGETDMPGLEAAECITRGHKIALRDIQSGEDIVKYGVCIGRATMRIEAGTWVHLHNIRSVYDERSSHLDAVTGAPKDIKYE